MITVVTHLRWQVERTTQSGLTGLKQKLKPLIGVGGTTETCVLTHGPQPIAVHGWVHAAGVGLLAWCAERSCWVKVAQ